MRVDGAILFNRNESFHRQLRRRGIICVETGSRNLPFDHAAVYVDDVAVGQEAYLHLESCGFDGFAYCGPPGGNASSSRRSCSFMTLARSEGHIVEDFPGDWIGNDPLFDSLTRWLTNLPKPCGVLAFDDKIAERIVAACRCAEISIPEDIGVLGVGNDELICELLEPQLSSVRIPLRQVGYRAAAVLEAIAQRRNVPKQQMIRPLDVAVRASTDRLAECDPSVRAAIDVLKEHAHEPIGTEEIARLIRVPRRTLERHFKNQVGRTVHDVLVEFRIRMAKNLLSRTTESVGEIALRCGYLAKSAFIRMFEQEVGHRPDTYRRLVRD
jgi:LacI family transcriptional regulator